MKYFQKMIIPITAKQTLMFLTQKLNENITNSKYSFKNVT